MSEVVIAVGAGPALLAVLLGVGWVMDKFLR